MEDRLGTYPVILQLPLGDEEKFCGVIDLLRMQAFVYDEDNLGVGYRTTEIPDSYHEQVMQYKARLVEDAAELDEDLMERYLAEEVITPAELARVIRKGTIDNQITPVFCGAAFRNKGVQPLLDGIVDYLPSPVDVPPITGMESKSGQKVVRTADDNALAALAFKVMVDPYVGQLVFVRVYSGVLQAGSYVYNSTKGKQERIGRLMKMHANKREDVQEIHAGDIGAVIGLKNTSTGDTLCEASGSVVLEAMTFPEPVMSIAIEPKTKVDSDKLGVSLGKISRKIRPSACGSTRTRARPLFPAWVSCTLRFWWTGWPANFRLLPTYPGPRWRTGNRFSGRQNPKDALSGKAAVGGSTVTSRCVLSPWNVGPDSYLKMPLLVARFPGNIFLPWRRALPRPCSTVLS